MWLKNLNLFPTPSLKEPRYIKLRSICQKLEKSEIKTFVIKSQWIGKAYMIFSTITTRNACGETSLDSPYLINKHTTIFHVSLLLQSVPITQLLSYITIYPKQQPPNAIQQYNIEQRKMICPLIKRETIFFFLSYILREGRADHKIWKVGHLQNHISVSILIGHFDPGYIWESQEDLSDSIIGFCICARLTACMGSQGETKWTRKKTFVFKKNILLLTKNVNFK